jgi:hypothetical protein
MLGSKHAEWHYCRMALLQNGITAEWHCSNAIPLEWDPLSGAAGAACMIGLSGVCMVGDRNQVLALPCSTPLGCEGSTPLLIGPGTGHPGDGRRTGSLCPCGACSLAVPLPGTLSFI